MIHSISSTTNDSRRCLSPLPNAAKKSFTVWTFSSMLINTSPFLGSDRVRSTPWLGPATGLLKTKARIARKHGRWIAVANAADEVRLDSRAREKGLIDAGVVEARHRAAVQSQRPRSDDEVSALQRSVSLCRHLGHVWCRKVLLHDLGIVRQKLW